MLENFVEVQPAAGGIVSFADDRRIDVLLGERVSLRQRRRRHMDAFGLERLADASPGRTAKHSASIEKQRVDDERIRSRGIAHCMIWRMSPRSGDKSSGS